MVNRMLSHHLDYLPIDLGCYNIVSFFNRGLSSPLPVISY
jgi:hypothetical protein